MIGARGPTNSILQLNIGDCCIVLFVPFIVLLLFLLMLCSLPKKKEFPCLYGKRTSLCVHCCALVISGEPSTDLCLCWTLHALLDVCRYLLQYELRDLTTRALLPKSQFPFLLTPTAPTVVPIPPNSAVGTWLGGFASERTKRGASSVLCLTTKGWRKVGFSSLLIHFGTTLYFRLL